MSFYFHLFPNNELPPSLHEYIHYTYLISRENLSIYQVILHGFRHRSISRHPTPPRPSKISPFLSPFYVEEKEEEEERMECQDN